ncbi:MAG: (5-formylfuran-3-yl)methyl phosphate synthase [Planctomycetota bacterium]
MTAPRPSLLVSVRDADEARDALEGGADWIDLKEPLRGPLGPVETSVAASVVERVQGRVPVSAACGELLDFAEGRNCALAGLAGLRLLKFGTAGCGANLDWTERLEGAVSKTRKCGKLFALGAYADWRVAESPPPEDVLAAAASVGADWLLLDTYNKVGPGLLDLLSPGEVGILAYKAEEKQLGMAVAGRLCLKDFERLLHPIPSVLGVRGAVCVGGRAGRVSRERVAEAAAMISAVRDADRMGRFA